VWVTDFPLVEYAPEDKRYVSVHHPFTAPHDDDLERLEAEPAGVRAQAYDIVLNGTELGGGSVRIHRPDVQSRCLPARHPRGGSTREVRLPARRARLRRTTAWRHALGWMHRHAIQWRQLDPRRHRLPKDAARGVPDDRGASAVDTRQLRELDSSSMRSGWLESVACAFETAARRCGLLPMNRHRLEAGATVDRLPAGRFIGHRQPVAAGGGLRANGTILWTQPNNRSG